MVEGPSESDERKARMDTCRDACMQLLGQLMELQVARPVEAASAMMAVSIMVAFAVQGVGECDDVNACISEVSQVICRRVGKAVKRRNEGDEQCEPS